MSEYRRVSPDVIERWQCVEEISLSKLDADQAELQADLDSIEQPTDEELIESGRSEHPWYQDRAAIQERIEKLTEQIDFLNSLPQE